MTRSAPAHDQPNSLPPPPSNPPASSDQIPDGSSTIPAKATAARRELPADWNYPRHAAARRRQLILRAALQPRHIVTLPHSSTHPDGPRRPFQRPWL